jgi:hypothetical protein
MRWRFLELTNSRLLSVFFILYIIVPNGKYYERKKNLEKIEKLVLP